MVRSADLRASKYAEKQDSTVIGARFGAQKDSMIEQATQQFANQVNIELVVKDFLERNGIPSIQFPAYIGVAKKIAKMKTKFR